MSIISIIGYEFFQNAILAGIIASIACGVIGSFVVVKRMVSLAGGISHSAFGGIGLGYYLGINPLIGAAVFSTAAAAAISRIRNTAHQNTDTLIGAIWSGGMALGIMFVYLSPGFAPDLMSYLFGNILLVPSGEIIMMACLVAVILVVVFIFYNQLVAVTFDEEYATLMNINSKAVMTLLLVLTALTVVILIQVVGVILVIALLALPAAISREYTDCLSTMMVLSVVLGMIFTTGGIILSYLFDIPSGATIIILVSVVYIFILVSKKISERRKVFWG